ncbi:protease, putative [Streptococcus agalactiae H36B]|nr:protease, putative [Streptococcus agalactiae H36B]
MLEQSSWGVTAEGANQPDVQLLALKFILTLYIIPNMSGTVWLHTGAGL